MSSTERVALVLIALALTLGAVELVRREVALRRWSGERWWRIDASAGGALFTALASIGAWALLALDQAPTLGMVLAYLGVMVVLLVAGDRAR